MSRRVLAIGLDGYEDSLAREMMSAGALPHLARLRDESTRFLLDHGSAQRTGLAWEHVSTGRSPDAASRFAAVAFDPDDYAVWQEGTNAVPFPAQVASRTVVFDTPYFDLDRASSVRGLVDWGAHDPGTRTAARPAGLLAEFEARFGRYPAKESIYGFVWPSPERCRRMGADLTAAVDTRARAARWMLGERLPDWDLGIVVVSELHSAIEALWHGVDWSHPLHRLPSAPPAGEALRSVYRAVDRLVGSLVAAFPDATHVVFAMGGMGPNRSDVASMALLPELLYRNAFGESLMKQPREWSEAPNGCPLLGEDARWSTAINELLPEESPTIRAVRPSLARAALSKLLPRSSAPLRLPLGWMPAARYQPFWRRMKAFALPSFYDGRARINLAGREHEGILPVSRYEAACDQIEALVRECRNPVTGDGVVESIERPAPGDPRAYGATVSDLVIVWRGIPLALDHPRLGRIGPLPMRRPGGHTGPYGMAYLSGAGIEPGDGGVRSAFDVVPTLIELLGESTPAGMSGESLLAARELVS